MEKSDWKELKNEVLRALDIKQEYLLLGVEFTKDHPNREGWLECRAFGRQDRNPSSAVNIGDGELRGRYKEFVGDGRSLSLYDFAIESGKFSDFKSVLRHYLEKSGKSLPRGRPPETPEGQLVFKEYNKEVVANWCRLKPPIHPQAVQIFGGKVATFDTRSSFGVHTVVAFPFFGPGLHDSDPTGWAVYAVSGQMLPLPQGKGVEPKMLKVLTMKGSVSGFVGRFGLSILKDAELVWKVEGITDALALQSMILRYNEPCQLCSGGGCSQCHNGKVYPYVHKHAVVTTSGGAAEFPSEKYTTPLKGKRVFVVHDQDESGEIGTKKWFTELAKEASECRALKLPFPFVPSHGPDLRDYFNEGREYGALLKFADDPQNVLYTSVVGGNALAKPSVAIQSTSESRSSVDDIETLYEERRLCENIGIQVVGENEKMEVEVFSLRHGKTTLIKNISFLTVEQLIQICGEQVTAKINQSNLQDVPGTYRMPAIKRAIAGLAGYQRANFTHKSGLGCWHALDSQKNRRKSVVVVGGAEAFEWHVERCEAQRIKQPIWGGLTLDLRSEDTWYNYKTVEEFLHKAGDADWCRSVIRDTVTIFRNWNWKNVKHTPTIITGLVLASWVQTLWSWRPLVALTGPSSAGKSTLFEALDSIFGGLGLRSSKSSEAGIRQGLGNNASVLLCDEFESDSHRQKILELFRTSTKGDKMLKGTTDQRGQKFGLQHICWIAAIEVGLRKEPDRNRFITLDLMRLKYGKRGEMEWLPDRNELSIIGMKLLAIAIRSVHRAMEIADELRSHRKDKIDGRVIESYTIPVSILSAAIGWDTEKARELLTSILAEIEHDTSTNSDESDLISDILSSIVDCGGGNRGSVSQILDKPGTYGALSAPVHLEKSGIATVEAKRGPGGGPDGSGREKCLFIVPGVVNRVLLRGTRWQDQDIAQILKRVRGADVGEHRIAGHRQRGVRIPWAFMLEFFLGDHDTPSDLTEYAKQQDLNYDKDDQ